MADKYNQIQVAEGNNGNMFRRTDRWLITRVFRFYRDGFRQMTVGRQLWLMILIKVAILLFVFKLLFFPDLLNRDYDTDAERSQAVRTSLVGADN